jgi:Fe-S cluster biosynthesis and repair protein YggX
LETSAEFKWQHLGTVDAPSPIFELEKAKAELLKNFNAKQQSIETTADTDCSADTTTKSITKKAAKEPKEKKAKKQIEDKPKKRGANGYIFYKSLKHQEIKEQLQLEFPEMKGKELANKITSVASEQWNQLSEAEQAQYKKQAKDSIAETEDAAALEEEMPEYLDTPVAVAATPKADDAQSEDQEQGLLEIPSVDSEDEEDTLVFNEKHNVWVDTDNNLCYETKDTNPGPIGQVQRGSFLRFPTAKK